MEDLKGTPPNAYLQPTILPHHIPNVLFFESNVNLLLVFSEAATFDIDSLSTDAVTFVPTTFPQNGTIFKITSLLNINLTGPN